MSRVLFRQIPPGSKLLAIGNFFKSKKFGAQWSLAAFFERNSDSELQRLPLELSCVLAVGRDFIGEEETPYRSAGFKKTVVLPAIDTWQEKLLGECPRLAKKLAANSEIAAQKCFVFEVDGLTVWLPKFELARRMFFHAAFIVRAAFEPNSLDMAFSVHREGDVVHIHTPSKTGVPSQLLKVQQYRELFSWLLLNQDVKRSFESIWQRLNQQQKQATKDMAYTRWQFDFQAPTSLVGTTMNVRGPFNQERNELLVWEIEALQGISFSHYGEIFFHHPALKSSARGECTGLFSAPSGAKELEIDAEEEPTDTQEQSLIFLPAEVMTFSTQLSTKISYNGERTNGYGKKRGDEQVPTSKTSQLFGVADPVSDGSIASGELQKLGNERDDGNEYERFADRFSLLREILEQITQESEIELVGLEVKPLPVVPRCSFHMIDHEKPRCYLLAEFKLQNGDRRYLLEIDTTDNRKTMSTRIMGFKTEVDVGKSIEKILRDTVKGSLRWPSTMTRLCSPLRSVHHPQEGLPDVYQARVSGWKQRIHTALS